jgi:hypothetical protein
LEVPFRAAPRSTASLRPPLRLGRRRRAAHDPAPHRVAGSAHRRLRCGRLGLSHEAVEDGGATPGQALPSDTLAAIFAFA